MLVEILGNPCQAVFCSEDASYNPDSLFLPLHAMSSPVIELPVWRGKIYMKKQQENLDIAVVAYTSGISLWELLPVFWWLLQICSNCFFFFCPLFLKEIRLSDGEECSFIIACLTAGEKKRRMLASISVTVILMHSERCLSWWYPLKYALGLENAGLVTETSREEGMACTYRDTCWKTGVLRSWYVCQEQQLNLGSWFSN